MAHLTFAFDGKNADAQAAVDRYVRDYTWRISASTRKALNAIVERAIREGIPPMDAARLIMQHIGLDPRRAGAMMTFRERLVDAARSSASVNRATERFGKKLLRGRARTIARTETMGAMNAGSLESFKQAQADGLLDQDAGKEWLVSDPCEICAPLVGEAVPINKTFSNGLDAPPAHPACRCSLGPATAAEVSTSTLRPTAAVVPTPGILPQLTSVAIATISTANVTLGAGRFAALLELLR